MEDEISEIDLEGDLEVELDEDDLGEHQADELDFGQYLVDSGILSKGELAEALREKTEQPGISLLEIVSWLGYARYDELDRSMTDWSMSRRAA